MIVIDIETTGLDPVRHCMVSLGAVHYETGKTFYGECKVWNDQPVSISETALKVNGFTEEQILDPHKRSPIELYRDFCKWVTDECNGDTLLAGHNVGSFDVLFLQYIHKCFEIKKFPFSYRYVDLHSVYYAIFGESLSHSKICEALGLPSEPTPHNALSGALSEASCFTVLLSKP